MTLSQLQLTVCMEDLRRGNERKIACVGGVVLEQIGNFTDLSHMHLFHVLVTVRERGLFRDPFANGNVNYDQS